MSPEQTINPNLVSERFEGFIESVTAAPTAENPNPATVDLLHASMSKPHDALFIPEQAANPALGTWGKEHPVALIEFGYKDSDNPERLPLQMLVMKINDTLTQNMKNYGKFAEGFFENMKAGGYLLVVQDKTEDPQRWGMAIIKPTTGHGMVGRSELNLRWYDAQGGEGRLNEKGATFSPYNGNDSVSHMQVTFSHSNENRDGRSGLWIYENSENSETRVVTRTTPEQRAFLDAQQEMRKPAQPQSRKWLGGLARRQRR